MSEKSETLLEEQKALETRLNELTAERDQAGAVLTEARAAVVEGTGKTAALVVRQTAHNALSGAVDELQARIEAKRGEVTGAKAQDERAAKLNKMRALAYGAHQDLAELDSITRAAHEALNTLAPRAAAAFTAVFEKKVELETIARELKNIPATLPASGATATVDLQAIRGLSTGEIMSRMDRQPGAAPFSGFWQQAIQQALWEKHIAEVKNPTEAT
jgi:chromosome segregation ATPase